MPPVDSFAFVVFVLGLLLTIGGWLAFVSVAVKYGLHSSFRFIDGLRDLFTPQARRDRRRAGLFLAVTLAGMPLWMIGVMMGDEHRNAPCREACREEGYRSGRFRRSPHDAVDGVSQGPRACWCFHSERDWAPAALALPPP